MNAIDVKNLTKTYKIYQTPQDRLKEAVSLFRRKKYHRSFHSLNNLTFQVQKGESIGIIGKNGAGKSTLLKLLTGVITPTIGEVRVDGKISALLELGAGFNMEYTGIENIYLNGTLMGFTRQEMDKKIPDILKFADIGDFVYQPVKTYSTGMFVRLAFATAINVEPDILIVDEALAVGDLQFQLKCMDKFQELKEQGITILFVSHDLNAVRRFCKRAIWLHQGNLMEQGGVDLVCEHYENFLKLETADSNNTEESVTQNTNHVADIKSIELFNIKQEETDVLYLNEQAILNITYDVLDDTIKDPVLGVAIYTIDHQYICGLNTLLDGVQLPWKKGSNTITLKYHDMLILGGHYYFDVAIFDQTATVPISYMAKSKEFYIRGQYKAEGVLVIPHEWSVEDGK